MQLLSSYWSVNPTASDSAEGVQRWWLPASVDATLPEVVDALEWLVRRRLIEANATTDGRVRYRRRADASTADFAQLAAGLPGREPGRG